MIDGGVRPSEDLSWVFVTVKPSVELWTELAKSLVLGFVDWVVVPLPEGTSHEALREDSEALSMEVRAGL